MAWVALLLVMVAGWLVFSVTDDTEGGFWRGLAGVLVFLVAVMLVR